MLKTQGPTTQLHSRDHSVESLATTAHLIDAIEEKEVKKPKPQFQLSLTKYLQEKNLPSVKETMSCARREAVQNNSKNLYEKKRA